MSANDIRKSLNILNESVDATDATDVTEASPMGTFATLKATAKSLIPGSGAKGELDTGLKANKLFDAYKIYLKKIGRGSAQEGTVKDLYSFLTSEGIDMKKISKAFKKSFGIDIKSKQDFKRYAKTKHASQDLLAKTFLNVVQLQAAKAKPSFTPPGTPPGTPPASSTSASLSDDELKNLIQQIKGSPATDASEINVWKTALKNAGLIS